MRSRLLPIVLALVAAGPLAAQQSLPPAPFANRQLDDAAQEAQAQDLMETLRCLVCQGQSIADSDAPLAGHVLGMIFEKNSTRTRVSFDMAIRQLGGSAMVMEAGSMQIGRGETIADTARVLSRYVDAIMIRTDDHAKIEELAEYASVPVINGLTDLSHPCQIVADLLTIVEGGKALPGLELAWLGDGNNVLASLIEAAGLFGFIFVFFNRYETFEIVMKWLVGFMFVIMVGLAILVAPNLGDMAAGLTFDLPEGSLFYTLGLIGGVGGTITTAAYGYWTQAKGWRGLPWVPMMRTDNALAYIVTGLFVVAMLIGCGIAVFRRNSAGRQRSRPARLVRGAVRAVRHDRGGPVPARLRGHVAVLAIGRVAGDEPVFLRLVVSAQMRRCER